MNKWSPWTIYFRNKTHEKKNNFIVLFTIKQINFANKLNKEYNTTRPIHGMLSIQRIDLRKFPYKGQPNILQFFFFNYNFASLISL